MKIAISAKGPGPEFDVDNCFARSYWFVLYDTAAGSWEAIDNSANRLASANAGVRAARLLTEHGVELLLSIEAGPKAFRALASGGITFCQCLPGTAVDALLTWQKAKTQPATAANGTGSPTCLVGATVSASEPAKGAYSRPVRVY